MPPRVFRTAYRTGTHCSHISMTSDVTHGSECCASLHRENRTLEGTRVFHRRCQFRPSASVFELSYSPTYATACFVLPVNIDWAHYTKYRDMIASVCTDRCWNIAHPLHSTSEHMIPFQHVTFAFPVAVLSTNFLRKL
jgi:hypothetical protein